jgi:hypothetical protein
LQKQAFFSKRNPDSVICFFLFRPQAAAFAELKALFKSAIAQINNKMASHEHMLVTVMAMLRAAQGQGGRRESLLGGYKPGTPTAASPQWRPADLKTAEVGVCAGIVSRVA